MSPATSALDLDAYPVADPNAGAHAPKFIPFVPNPRKKIRWAEVTIMGGAGVGVLIMIYAATILMGISTSMFGLPLREAQGMDILSLGLLVAMGPFGYVQWRRRATRLALDSRLPDFLTDLAGLHKAGLTLQESLLTAAQGDYGPLNPIIRQTADQVRWNIPILTALEGFQKRLGTPIAERTLTVVLEAGRTGGNVPQVLEISAANARAFVNLRDQRARSMGLYTIITYVASLIFIGVCLAMQGVFVPQMIAAFQGAGGALGLKALPTADQFRTLFYTAALVQAVGNGIVGGIMSEGNVLAGLKHAWTMTLLCFGGFLLT